MDPEQLPEMVVEGAGTIARNPNARLQGPRHAVPEPGGPCRVGKRAKGVEAPGARRVLRPAAVERPNRIGFGERCARFGRAEVEHGVGRPRSAQGRAGLLECMALKAVDHQEDGEIERESGIGRDMHREDIAALNREVT